MPPATEPEFDPIGIFKALDRARVTYIVIGGLARVLQGTDELTNGVDIVPAMREENLRRLDVALGELNARRRDGKKNLALANVDVLDLETDLGELKIVPEPAGTRGYDDPAAGGSSAAGRAARRVRIFAVQRRIIDEAGRDLSVSAGPASGDAQRERLACRLRADGGSLG